jgi:hypothetical protein
MGLPITLDQISTEDIYHRYPYGTLFLLDRLFDLNAGHFPVFYTRYEGKLYASTSILSLASFTKRVALNPFCVWMMKQKFVHVIWYPFFHTYLKGVYRLKPFQEVTPTGQRRVPGTEASYFHFRKELPEFIRLTAKAMIDCVHHYEEKYPTHKHIVAVGGMDARFILAIPKKHPENWIVYSLPPDASSVAEFVKVNKMPYECWFPEWPREHPETDVEYKQKIILTQGLMDPVHFREGAVLKPYLKPHEKYLFWTGDLGDCLTTVQPEYQRWNPFLYFAGLASRGSSYQGFSSLYMLGALGIPYVPFYHYTPMWTDVFLRFNPGIIHEDTRNAILAELDKMLGQKTQSVKGPGTPKPTPRLPYGRAEVMLEAIREIQKGVSHDR